MSQQGFLIGLNLWVMRDNNSVELMHNGKKRPMLYFWNTQDYEVSQPSLMHDLMHDCKFIRECLVGVDLATYSKMMVSYFVFSLDMSQEDFTATDDAKLSDFLAIDEFDSTVMVEDALLEHMMSLYKKSIGTDYPTSGKDSRDSIREMCLEISSRYKDKISVMTIANWVRSELQTRDMASQHNSDVATKHFIEIVS